MHNKCFLLHYHSVFFVYFSPMTTLYKYNVVNPEKVFNSMKYMENDSRILYRFQQGMQ